MTLSRRAVLGAASAAPVVLRRPALAQPDAIPLGALYPLFTTEVWSVGVNDAFLALPPMAGLTPTFFTVLTLALSACGVWLGGRAVGQHDQARLVALALGVAALAITPVAFGLAFVVAVAACRAS